MVEKPTDCNPRACWALQLPATHDASTGTWVTLAPMPTARRDLAAASGSVQGIGYIYAIGGHGVEWPLTTVERYKP